MFEAERGCLVHWFSPFDGFHCVPASKSKTFTVRFDNNKYSVLSTAVGRSVEIHAYADRIVITQDGVTVAEHRRGFGRGDTVYDLPMEGDRIIKYPSERFLPIALVPPMRDARFGLFYCLLALPGGRFGACRVSPPP